MIVLDTNVLSELMRASPDPHVFAWVAAQPRVTLYTTCHNQAEILFGITLLPVGRRRTALEAAAEMIFRIDMAGKVLPFTGEAAVHYAGIVAARRREGRPIDAFDALIAACALAAGAGIATRDVAGFEGCGLPAVINPWTVVRQRQR